MPYRVNFDRSDIEYYPEDDPIWDNERYYDFEGAKELLIDHLEDAINERVSSLRFALSRIEGLEKHKVVQPRLMP